MHVVQGCTIDAKTPHLVKERSSEMVDERLVAQVNVPVLVLNRLQI